MKTSWGYLATANDTLAVATPNVGVYDITVGTGAASAVVTIYNGDSTSDPVAAVIDCATARHVNLGGIRLSDGLFAKLTVGNAKVTISYR